MGGQIEHKVRKGLLAAVMLAAGLAAHAASGTGTLPVTAHVVPRAGCLILSGTGGKLNFGTIDQASLVNATAATTVVVRCRGNILVNWNLEADSGANPSGTNVRRLRHATMPAELMPYTLGMNPTSGWWSSLFGTGNTTINITGTITPANFQNVASGVYNDSVKLTVNY